MSYYNIEWFTFDGSIIANRTSFVSINTSAGRFYINSSASELLESQLDEDAYLKAIEVGLDLDKRALAFKPLAHLTRTSISLYTKHPKQDAQPRTFTNQNLIDRIREIVPKGTNRFPAFYDKEVDALIVDLARYNEPSDMNMEDEMNVEMNVDTDVDTESYYR